jgi:hypothetical protein
MSLLLNSPANGVYLAKIIAGLECRIGKMELLVPSSNATITAKSRGQIK